MLERYIEAEKKYPNFIARGMSKVFKLESFVYLYYAGHGCSDNRQYVLLNENDIDKIFWAAEAETKTLLKRCGSSCKAIVIFDCCREDYSNLR